MTSILVSQIHFERCSRSKLESFEAQEPFESSLQPSASSPFRLQHENRYDSVATKLEIEAKSVSAFADILFLNLLPGLLA